MLVTGAPCRPSATRLGRAAAGLEPALEGTCVHVQQVQAELGAPPQNVLRGARKFLAAQVLDLALVQLRQQLASQVRERAGGPEQALEARAVRMGVAPAHARGQPRIAPLERAQKHRKAPLRQVTAGELPPPGPGGGLAPRRPDPTGEPTPPPPAGRG